MPNTISANDVALSGSFDIDITGTANNVTHAFGKMNLI